MKKTNGWATFLFCAATLLASLGTPRWAAGAAVYDLSADFSTNANPGGAWSYGWKSTLDGAFTLYARHGFELQDGGGGQWDYWLKPGGGASAVYHNSGTITITNNGGQGVYPPGTVVIDGGYEGNPDNYCVIRLTIPAGAGGVYQMDGSVRSHVNGSLSGDADFHILVNGVEIYGQNIPTNSSAAFSQSVLLADGDALDFASGRGADGHEYGSGLKIQATLNPSTNSPPPGANYDLSRDFDKGNNPGGAWSLGWKSTVEGELHLDTVPRAVSTDNGVLIDTWSQGPETADVEHNGTTQTAIANGGAQVIPPGNIKLGPGHEWNEDHYSVARLTIPPGGGGTYRVEIGVASYLSGPNSGDADFHIVKDGVEIFGQNVPGNGSASYSNTISLAAGEYLDFACGVGADGIGYASALNFASKINLIDTNPGPLTIVSQPRSLTVNEGDAASFSVGAAGASPLFYQWRFNGDDISGATAARLSFEHVSRSDAGDYTVVVSNDSGSVTSQVATLTVVRPRVLALGGNISQQEGTTIVLPITLISEGDVAGMTFNINYDPTYLRQPQLAWTSLLDGSFTSINTNTPGQVRATFGSASAMDAGTQTLAQVSFFLRSVPNTLTTALALQIVDASDANGNPLTGTIERSAQVTNRVRRIVGDNNANDRLDVGDATVVLRYLSNLEPPRSWDAALNDLNQTGTLDSGDSVRILRAASGIDPQPTPPGLLAASKTFSAASLASGTPNAVLSPARIQTAPGSNITIQVQLQNVASPVAGASFRLNYDTNALRLINSQSYHLGPMVPGSALAVWNVAPSQNNFATQNGTVSLAVSSASQWANNQGVLAEFTFQVQSRATTQYLWPVTLSAVETTEDGYINHQLAAAGASVSARAPVGGTMAGGSRIVDGHYSLSVSGDAGASYVIEASTDLRHWDPIATVPNTSGTVQVTDNEAASHDHRFYRARPAAGQ